MRNSVSVFTLKDVSLAAGSVKNVTFLINFPREEIQSNRVCYYLFLVYSGFRKIL